MWGLRIVQFDGCDREGGGNAASFGNACHSEAAQSKDPFLFRRDGLPRWALPSSQ